MGRPDPTSAHRAVAQARDARRRAHSFIAAAQQELVLAAAYEAHGGVHPTAVAKGTLDRADLAAELRRNLEEFEQSIALVRPNPPIRPPEATDGP